MTYVLISEQIEDVLISRRGGSKITHYSRIPTEHTYARNDSDIF